jgi:hypothetical protein
MSQKDRQPLPDSAGIELIMPTANDRLGAVFSALYSFWIARQAAAGLNSPLDGGRRDAYSLILFNHEPSTSIENDLTSSPDELLTAALRQEAAGGKNFTSALERTQIVMNSHWSRERCGSLTAEKFDADCDTLADMHHRTPVVIFSSDDEDSDNVSDEAIYDVCRSAVRQGFVDFHPERYFSL